MNIVKDYHTATEVARRFNTTEANLKERRDAGKGPPWEYRSGRVQYRTTDLIIFDLARCKI